eukprot:1279329-Rhodomonas_salina.2
MNVSVAAQNGGNREMTVIRAWRDARGLSSEAKSADTWRCKLAKTPERFETVGGELRKKRTQSRQRCDDKE